MGLVSVEKLIEEKIGSFLGSFVRSCIDNSQSIKESLSPTLIIHGKEDTLIPYQQMQELKESCQKQPDLLLFEGMDHYNFDIVRHFILPIENFLKKLDNICSNMSSPKSTLYTRPERCERESISSNLDYHFVQEEANHNVLRSSNKVQTLLSKSSIRL